MEEEEDGGSREEGFLNWGFEMAERNEGGIFPILSSSSSECLQGLGFCSFSFSVTHFVSNSITFFFFLVVSCFFVSFYFYFFFGLCLNGTSFLVLEWDGF